MPMGGPLSLWEKPSCKKLRGPMGGTKSKPNAVDSIWNGGARERQNECAMSFAIEMKKLVASDMSLATSWQGVTISNPACESPVPQRFRYFEFSPYTCFYNFLFWH